jgi:hydrogenase expression/formation protein HypC
MGKIDFGGVVKEACLEHVPHVSAGDYVLVHVGFALARIDEREARQIFSFLEEMNELGELRTAPDDSAARDSAPAATGDATQRRRPS